MKKFRLKITEKDFEELQRLVLADMPREAGAFALAGVARHDDYTDIIVRRPLPIPKGLFRVQHEFRLEMHTQAINGLIALCEANNLGAILCHSHPKASPYSPSDDHGEYRIFSTLRKFIPPNAPTASLLFYPAGVRGRVWLPDSKDPIPISEIVILGRHLQRIQSNTPSLSVSQNIDDLFDRQVRAFGKRGQALIAQTKVGIVGVGGTGSPTAEQLIRLGVEDLVLIDPDEFELSNLTRVYGTYASALRRYWWQLKRKAPLKVELVASNLRRISPQAKIKAIPKNVVLKEAAMHLLDRDVVFLCTDDHWGRSIVNQIAYQYFIPTINLGMHVAANDGFISDAVGIVDVLRPDSPCLWCRQFLSSERINAESIPYRDRMKLQQEGYVENIDTPTPSVVSITTTLAGMAVSLYLQLVTDFMGLKGDVSRLNYDVLASTVRRGTGTIPSGCVCSKVRGFGDLSTLPTLSDLSFLTAR